MSYRLALTWSLMVGVVAVALAGSNGGFYVQRGNRMEYVPPSDSHTFQVKEWQMWYYHHGYAPNGSREGVWGVEVDRDRSALMRKHAHKIGESCEARRGRSDASCEAYQRFFGPIAILEQGPKRQAFNSPP
jgi:phosphoribosylformylglycinamidine (FGAM) synthase-like amidotransferase family enzyme